MIKTMCIYIYISAYLSGNSFAATCAQAKLIASLVNSSCWKNLSKQNKVDSQLCRSASSCSVMDVQSISHSLSCTFDDTPEKSTSEKTTPEKSLCTFETPSRFESSNEIEPSDIPLEDDIHMDQNQEVVRDIDDSPERPIKRRRLRGKTNCSTTGYPLVFPALESNASSGSQPKKNVVQDLQDSANQQVREKHAKRKRGRPEGNKDPRCEAGLRREREGKSSTVSIWTKMKLIKDLCLRFSNILGLQAGYRGIF